MGDRTDRGRPPLTWLIACEACGFRWRLDTVWKGNGQRGYMRARARHRQLCGEPEDDDGDAT